MLLKNKTDIRTVLFALLTTLVLFANWTNPEFNLALFLLACFLAVAATAMVHNHLHVPIYRFKILNMLHDYWLTLAYGYPVFAWIPTHNQNHHVYANKKGDFVPTYAVGEENNLFTLLIYPTYSGMKQQKPNLEFIKKIWKTNPLRCLYFLSQAVVLIAFVGGAFLINWEKALLYIFIPQQIGLNMVLVFNYVQHVHCDEETEFSNSRNIVGWMMNALLFNNGYHTAHHYRPMAHWSELPALHAKIQDRIPPSLNEPSFVWYIFRAYILGIFIKGCRTRNMRAERIKNHPPLNLQDASPAV